MSFKNPVAALSLLLILPALSPLSAQNKVDLTRYDSPEAERWRTQYGITGVPTILFLTPEGEEVRSLRVEGFLPPEPFLERMRLATSAKQTAER